MTTTQTASLKTAIDNHHAESKRITSEMRQQATRLDDPDQRRRVETLLRAHEAMSDWFHDDALALVSPTN